MMCDLKNLIIKDLMNDDLLIDKMLKAKEEDLIYFHFSLGAFIRNKYLYHKNIDELKVFFNTNNIDDISYLIMKDFYLLINKKYNFK